jgi:hypothetical protein
MFQSKFKGKCFKNLKEINPISYWGKCFKLNSRGNAFKNKKEINPISYWGKCFKVKSRGKCWAGVSYIMGAPVTYLIKG